MSTAERYDDYRGYRQDRWCGASVRFHPGWIVLMILGFIFWWPIGLAILAFTIWSRNMGCYGSDRWQRKMERMEEKMGRMRDRVQGLGAGGFGGGPWGAPRSSGNHAFDEYRTETLRRLEEEQREFRDFLDRLRFAKDKSEFDQFMAERRNRPQPPAPPAPQPQS
jgi:hypothetical protein